MAIEVEGLAGFRKALKALSPQLAKNMNNRIKAELVPIIQDARAKVPNNIFGGVDNWTNYRGQNPGASYFPYYNGDEIRNGLTYSMGRQKKSKSGFVSMITLLNKDAAGVIAETAGRTHPQGRPQYAQRFTRGGIGYYIRGSRQSLSDNPKAGQMMIDRLNNGMGTMKNYKSASNKKTEGRLLYAAYAENQGKALDAIMKAIQDAQREFNRQSVLYDTKVAA